MKRFIAFKILCLCFLGMVNGQIPTTQTSDSPYEYVFVGHMDITINKKTQKMTLTIHSDNQYENKVATLQLGTGTTAAINSLKNLKNAIGKDNAVLKLGGYTIETTYSGEASVTHAGPMQYAAGNYSFTDYQIENLMFQLLKNDSKAQLGNSLCIVEKFSNYSGLTMNITLVDYNVSTKLTLLPIGHTDDVIKVSPKDTLSIDQIQIICKGIRENLIRDNEDSQFFLRIGNL